MPVLQLVKTGEFATKMYESMDLSGNIAVIGARGGELSALENGVAFVYTRSSTSEPFAFRSELVPEDQPPIAHGNFGHAVAAAASTRTVVVSALGVEPHFEVEKKTTLGNMPSVGAAYVFVEDSNGGWVQQAKLVPSDGFAGDLFGRYVAVDDDTVVVSADSSAYIYRRGTDNTWKQEAKVRVEKATGGAGPYAPHASISGDMAALSTSWCQGGGAVFMFERSLKFDRVPVWTQKHKLTAAGATDAFFGRRVSLQRDLLAVSAHGYTQDSELSDAPTGAVIVFELDQLSKTWREVDQLSIKNIFGRFCIRGSWYLMPDPAACASRAACASYAACGVCFGVCHALPSASHPACSFTARRSARRRRTLWLFGEA